MVTNIRLFLHLSMKQTGCLCLLLLFSRQLSVFFSDFRHQILCLCQRFIDLTQRLQHFIPCSGCLCLFLCFLYSGNILCQLVRQLLYPCFDTLLFLQKFQFLLLIFPECLSIFFLFAVIDKKKAAHRLHILFISLLLVFHAGNHSFQLCQLFPALCAYFFAHIFIQIETAAFPGKNKPVLLHRFFLGENRFKADYRNGMLTEIFFL